MARFRCRAPYLRSVPSCSRNLLAGRRHAEQKLAAPRVQHALLHHAQLDLQNLLQLLMPQRMKHHHLVQPVHELRRKLLLRRFLRRSLHFHVQSVFHLVLRLHEAHAAGHQFRDLSAAQVRRQENHGLRQIHAPVVSQRQRRLIQNSQQQLPQRVRRLLDFIEQQETQLQIFSV